MDDFLLRAAAGGVGVALVTGPLGCFVVWRRMAYFGDALAHTALLGVALGFLLSLDLQVGILAVCAAAALLLGLLERQERWASDTLLGILSHSALSLGLVLISLAQAFRVDLMGYLFGDILAIGRADLVWIYAGGGTVLAVLVLLWRRLLALTVHEELAQAEGVPVGATRLAFLLIMAVTVAIAMKIVGIVLLTALLIIPAAAARPFVRTPEQMAVLAAALGAAAVLAGLFVSTALDTPSGPSVVIAAAAIFVLGLLFGARSPRLRPTAP